METLTPPSVSLREARRRAIAVRRDLDVILKDVLNGTIDQVSTLEVALKEMEANHGDTTYQELVNLAAPRLRVLWMRNVHPHGILTDVAPDVRAFLDVDRLVDA